jgi:hypothetical protein
MARPNPHEGISATTKKQVRHEYWTLVNGGESFMLVLTCIISSRQAIVPLTILFYEMGTPDRLVAEQS